MGSDFSQIGKIVSPHGVRGEIKVRPATSYPEEYLDLAYIYISDFKYKVENFRHSRGGFWLLKLLEIKDRDSAEEFRGLEIQIEDFRLLPLAADEFFVHELIGSKVYSSSEEFLGEIVHYFETGANGVCEVRAGKKNFYFPTTQEIFLEFHSQRKKVIIEPIPGLLE